MPTAKHKAVNHQYFIQAPPERVFGAITEPARLVQWLANAAELEPRQGGRYLLGWTDGPTHTGTLLEYVPGKSVAFSWEWPGVELRGTVFKLAVESKEDGSLLTVEHTGFPNLAKWVDLLTGAEWGWTYFAMNLKSVLETGRDLRSKYDG